MKDLSNKWATSPGYGLSLRHHEFGRLSLDNTKQDISVSETFLCTRQRPTTPRYHEYFSPVEGCPHGAAQASATTRIPVSSSSLIPRTPGARVALASLQWGHRGAKRLSNQLDLCPPRPPTAPAPSRWPVPIVHGGQATTSRRSKRHALSNYMQSLLRHSNCGSIRVVNGKSG